MSHMVWERYHTVSCSSSYLELRTIHPQEKCLIQQSTGHVIVTTNMPTRDRSETFKHRVANDSSTAERSDPVRGTSWIELSGAAFGEWAVCTCVCRPAVV